MPHATPFAVHIGPGLLNEVWWVSGFVFGGLVVLLSLWRVHERDVPRIGVLTAAFFVASSVHIPLGGASVHLLLNGLVGVILRWRAALAVAVGLTLQTFLVGHGGPDALGVNFAVLTLPALLAGVVSRQLFKVMPAFAAGVIVGGGTAVITVLLHAVVLYFGLIATEDDPRKWIAGVSLVAHLPVIAIEAVGVGFACRVLAKAKPEWLGIEEGPHPPSPSPERRGGVQGGCPSDTSASGPPPARVEHPLSAPERGTGGEVSAAPFPLPAPGTEGKVDPSNG